MTLAPPPLHVGKKPRRRPIPKLKPARTPDVCPPQPPPTVAPAHPPPATLDAGLPLRRFSTDEYQQMVAAGILPEDNAYEFLDGLVVWKMGEGPIHASIMSAANKVIGLHLPDGWHLRFQNPLVTQTSLPEPDVGVVRGEPEDYEESHPSGSDFALAIEIADSSLAIDRKTKRPIYARIGVPVYWIIDLNARRLELYTDPSGDVVDPTYRSLVTLDETQTVPLVLDGKTVAQIPVRSLLPKRKKKAASAPSPA